jgi:hypothetical protein
MFMGYTENSLGKLCFIMNHLDCKSESPDKF